MKNNTVHLVLADPSLVVMNGLKAVLERSNTRFETYYAENLSAVEQLLQRHPIDLVLMNPVQIANIEKQFTHIKNEYPSVKWVAILYGWFDDSLTSLFDSRILLNDSAETIQSVVQNTLEDDRADSSSHRQPLSDRELDVLRLLVLGMSNKEIADKLFISTYTVISHRKNITQKTGIKSVSGLTIYAVVKGIVSLPNSSE